MRLFHKMVQFENGKYGIRRPTLIGYQYLDASTSDEPYWWYTKECVSRYAQGSQEQMLRAYKHYREYKKLEQRIGYKVVPWPKSVGQRGFRV